MPPFSALQLLRNLIDSEDATKTTMGKNKLNEEGINEEESMNIFIKLRRMAITKKLWWQNNQRHEGANNKRITQQQLSQVMNQTL